MKSSAFFLAAAFLLGCSPSEQAAPTDPSTPAAAATASSAAINIDDPETCRACHGPIVQEWSESMHARAHYDRDPVFAAMRDLRAIKQGPQIVPKCRNCHTPRDTEDESTLAAKAGVSCATCHNAAHVTPSEVAKGAALISFDPAGTLRSARDVRAGASPAHPTGPAAPHLADGSSICLACHGAVANGAGAPTCTTGSEIAGGSQAGASCTSCHMPSTDGASGPFSARPTHASHQFPGPHRAWYQDDVSMLASAVALDLSWEGDAVLATLSNQAAHAFPSGFPGRMATLAVVGFDESGATVWEDLPSAPSQPGALLRKVYVDDAGKPTLPPFAKALKEDTRLTADEVRTLRWSPPAEVTRVQATLRYFLLPPPAAKAIGIQDAPESKPVVVAQTEAKRPR